MEHSAPVQPATSSHPVQPSSHPCVASVQIAQSCTTLAQPPLCSQQPPRAAQSCTALVQPPLCSQQPSPVVTQPCAANSQQTPRAAQPQPRAAQSSPFPCSPARNPAVLLYPSGKRKTRWILGKEPKPAEAPTALHGKSGHPTWILDSGANNHMTGELATFTSPVTSVNQSVCIADGSSIPIRSQGDARLSSDITLSSVYHDLSSKKIFGKGYERNGLYYFGDPLPSHVWGPSPVTALSQHRYYVTFIDDYTRCTWVYLMRNKSEFGVSYGSMGVPKYFWHMVVLTATYLINRTPSRMSRFWKLFHFFSDSTPSPDPDSKILAADDPIPPRPLPILESPSSPFASQDPSPCAQAPLPASSPESGMSPPLVSDILPPRYQPSQGELLPDPSVYQRLVGRLIYLTNTRPDLTFAVSIVSQFMHSPRTSHLDDVYHILRYLKSCPGRGLFYKSRVQSGLSCFTDADYAGSKSDRRSTSGFCTFHGSHLISWKSKKQAVVSRTSAEAEYRAMAQGTSEILWLRSLLTELGFSMIDSSYLFCDNKSAIMLSSDSVLHERTKHIEVDIHFIREKVRSGVITPSFVPSYAQTADMFTKSIGPSLLKSSLVKLGLVDIFASA
ncbi:hypothetical protein Acr_00g0060930 [Actinidia rufa]|uniref:Retrovirus-related Pol polyprotein from transposon TNT 1-94-like beta-barrel domain-containing protein n=1 Tax=Actinidia rufa TaxID=165716 RepID=A0A7J0DQI9_9ERIC|nr:hypothetical protein Acr_00g0060930 [Actinidia rufa]